MSPGHVVVVGGSTAGTTAVRELRRRGHDGRVTVVDPETGVNRPPLSKGVLHGDDPAAVTIDHGPLDVTTVRARATHLDVERHLVEVEGGDAITYDALVLATGSRAVRLAAPGQRGEHVLRTIDDSVSLRRRLAEASSVVVLGAGFLGMEVASAATRHAKGVTVVDPDPPLLRLLGPHLADHFVRRARDHGIGFRRSSAELLGDPVHAVRLGDGAVLEAELVVTCVGDRPDLAWLDGSGITSDVGVPVDHLGRTRVPDVYAAGDVAALPDGSGHRRAPFWANAVAQGRVAAAGIVGATPDGPVHDPYFWTEIAGHPLKVVGPLPAGDAAPEVLEDAGDGAGILALGPATVAALGVPRSLPRLRALARNLDTLQP